MKAYLAGKDVNDLESVLQDVHGLNLLAVVAAVHHQRVAHTLNDGAGRLAETLNLVATSSVGKQRMSLSDVDVIHKAELRVADTIREPFAKKLQFSGQNGHLK